MILHLTALMYPFVLATGQDVGQKREVAGCHLVCVNATGRAAKVASVVFMGYFMLGKAVSPPSVFIQAQGMVFFSVFPLSECRTCLHVLLFTYTQDRTRSSHQHLPLLYFM